MMFGKFFYDDLKAANPTLAPLFFFPFTIVFFFIVMNFFSVSMRSLYMFRLLL